MIQESIEQLIEPMINDMGYVLWGCEYISQGKHSLLRIYIDNAIGINIDDCQKVSKQVAALLDVEDPIAGNYSLEISSPGIPRPLFKIKHYQTYIGQNIQLKTYKPINGQRKLVGTIVSVSDNTLVLDINNDQQELLFTNIAKASLTI